MPIETNHPDYDFFLATWTRARDVLAGEDAVKIAGERYLRRVQDHNDDEYDAYRSRTGFYNATARTAAGFIGMIFRRAPFIKLPPSDVMTNFANDADLLGTTLYGYAKQAVSEVIHVGRAGTLIDWESAEDRPYAAFYHAEDIVNWRVERIAGRAVPTLIVLAERVTETGKENDPFIANVVQQRRVLKLVPDDDLAKVGRAVPSAPPNDATRTGARGTAPTTEGSFRYEVELWRQIQKPNSEPEWKFIETRIPLRRGEPLRQIPFVFHGPRHSRPAIDKPPLDDVITVNLDHYRLDADYKHGIHFTALPTVWLAGFSKENQLKIGSAVAWFAENPSARAGFVEYQGHGLGSFERALERDERLMALLGSRLLETQKRVAETAEALAIRQAGEESILTQIATTVSEGITQILRWVHWWSAPDLAPDIQPHEIGDDQLIFELNTDFGIAGMTARELQAVVAAWQAGALSRDTMFELFRKGEILPDGRTNEEETRLLGK